MSEASSIVVGLRSTYELEIGDGSWLLASIQPQEVFTLILNRNSVVWQNTLSIITII